MLMSQVGSSCCTSFLLLKMCLELWGVVVAHLLLFKMCLEFVPIVATFMNMKLNGMAHVIQLHRTL